MHLSEFDFHLPEELIATEPANPRDSSRLLVIGHELEDKMFRDLPTLLSPDDLLVFNNSKVIPARIFATPLSSPLIGGAEGGKNHKNEGGKNFEILLHRKLATNKWNAFIKGSKKLKPADILTHKNLEITILNKSESGEIEIELNDESLIEEYGHMPLPPYIKRADTKSDHEDYQTIYAQHKGSVAAPTAGLHFTNELLDALPNKAFVTLHVGAGTFQPVKTDNIKEHQMHSEWYEISPETEAAIANCKGRVIAVGTTSARVLEASNGKAGSGDTDIFIYPGYEFKIVDALITNFHLPKSSLFMLVSALAGTEKMHKAYAHAIKKKYRFYSYGDGCFIT